MMCIAWKECCRCFGAWHGLINDLLYLMTVVHQVIVEHMSWWNNEYVVECLMLPRRLSTLSRGECVQPIGFEGLGLPLAAGPRCSNDMQRWVCWCEDRVVWKIDLWIYMILWYYVYLIPSDQRATVPCMKRCAILLVYKSFFSAACGRWLSRSCTEQAGPCKGTAFAPEADDWRGPGCSHCEGGLFAGHVEGPWSILPPYLEVFHHVPLMPGCSMHWNHECDVFFVSFLLSINDELLGKVRVFAFRLFQICPQVIIPLRYVFEDGEAPTLIAS